MSVDRNTRILVIARGVRTLGQSAITLLLALYLNALGLDLVHIGLVLSVDVAGTFSLAVAVGLIGNMFGRRRLLTGIMLLASVASLVMAFTTFVPAILVAVFFGSFTAGSGAGGPLQPLEVASIAEVAPAELRTRLLALMFVISTIATACGALLIALPPVTERLFGVDEVMAYRAMFVLYALFQLISAFLYMRLSSSVEAKMARREWSNPFKLHSRKRIFTLTALFAADGFGGSLIGQSLVAFWFSTRFGLTLNSLSMVFFVSSLLSAASLWASAKIAERIGLVKTMVLAHIPSNILLIAAAFSPVAWMAILFWQLRSLLAQMDIPARESYTMAVVHPEERVAMASIGGVGRSGAFVIGPATSTALWNTLGAAIPFLACGVVKIAYDLLLYTMFRKVKPPEEENGEISQTP